MSKAHIPLGQAKRIAAEIVDLLAPACERIEVAGSIRREWVFVGDIEIVAVPKVTADLFGETEFGVNELDTLCETLIDEGMLALRHVNQRSAWGERYKRAWYLPHDNKPIPLDLFAVRPPAQWGVIFALRTGPADFSKHLVTPAHKYGAMAPGMCVSDGALWRGGEMVPTPEEADFFAALGLPLIPPAERTVERLKAAVTAGSRPETPR